MSLIDALDGVLMFYAYGWATFDPKVKWMYNLFLTGTSSLVAFLVGSVELAGILVEKCHLLGKTFKLLGTNFLHFILNLCNNFLVPTLKRWGI